MKKIIDPAKINKQKSKKAKSILETSLVDEAFKHPLWFDLVYSNYHPHGSGDFLFLIEHGSGD